jgi:hypothetical protein
MEVLLGPPLPCSCSPIAISLPGIVVAAAVSLRGMAEQQDTETTCSRLLGTLQQAEQVGALVAVLGGHAKFQPIQKLEEAPLYFTMESVMVDSVLNPVTGVVEVWHRVDSTALLLYCT